MIKNYLIVFIVAVLLGACSSSPTSNIAGTTPQATLNQPTVIQPTVPANTQAAPSLSADEVYKAVSAAWKKQETAGSRHISQTSSEGLSIEADAVPPDFHQVVSAMGSVVAEQYIVGGTIYNYDQGSWTQAAGGGAALGMIGSFSLNLSGDLVYSNGMVNGVEVINGSPAILYSYSTTLKGLAKTAQYKLWVDQSSGLPVKAENTNPEGSVITMLYTYDPSITISLPDEVKNAPPSN
jgi:uncharacterized protein (DUF736 family)